MKPMNKFMAPGGAARRGVAVAGLLLSGGMSTNAYAEARPLAGPTQTAAPWLFDTLDANKDQMLSRREFQAGYAGLQRLIVMQVRLREHFNALDANRSGAIEDSEYASLELIKRRGKAAPMLSAFDVDHDQKLNFAEYTVLVQKLATTQQPSKK